MPNTKPVKNNLLFHSFHGICRVFDVTGEKSNPCYEVAPVKNNHGKIRFSIPQDSLEDSGFNKVASEKQIEDALTFLETGKSPGEESHFQERIALLREEALGDVKPRDSRRRNLIKTTIHALICEISFVLELSIPETSELIIEKLGGPSKINDLVAAALNPSDLY